MVFIKILEIAIIEIEIVLEHTVNKWESEFLSIHTICFSLSYNWILDRNHSELN